MYTKDEIQTLISVLYNTQDIEEMRMILDIIKTNIHNFTALEIVMLWFCFCYNDLSGYVDEWSDIYVMIGYENSKYDHDYFHSNWVDWKGHFTLTKDDYDKIKYYFETYHPKKIKYIDDILKIMKHGQ